MKTFVSRDDFHSSDPKASLDSYHGLRKRAPLLSAITTALVLFAFCSQNLFAQRAASAVRDRAGRATKNHSPSPRDFSSKHFLLHTDLKPQEAKELLTKLETMLGLISGYWGRPPNQVIECYVVRDTSLWPEGALAPQGKAKIENGEGVTLSRTISRGNKFMAKAIVYSCAKTGVAQHEAVHAYCSQTFGRTGPTWYSEGMAEMGQYWKKDNLAVSASPYVIKYLQQSKPRQLTEIVEPDQPPGTWQDYAWRWALCHLLANNPNYNRRFRPLGLGLLNAQDVSFEQVYGPMAAEISFEYLFFLEHLDTGYRVDLCQWDWKKKFRPMKTTRGTVTAKVEAPRGWQPSGLGVVEGVEYEYRTQGTWQTSKKAKPTGPEGTDSGQGKLVGVLMTDYQLSEPFELGKEGTFIAPQTGNLYLRCQDKWNELADNKGRVTVKLKVKK